MRLDVNIPYTPRRAFKAFHASLKRWAHIIAHRRAGKTVAIVNHLQKKCIELKKPFPRFAYMAPTRVRAKDIAWMYLKRFAEPIPGIRILEGELAVEYPNKGRVTLYGADNDRGMGLYLDGIVFDECDEIPVSVDDVIQPALSDREGWAVWMGVLRGRHNLWKRHEKYKDHPDYFSLMLRASETGILPEKELNSLKERMGEVAYAMQMECDVNMSIANAIYGREMDAVRKDNRLRMVPVDRDLPLYTFWDIGYSDYTSLWLAQFSGRDICLCDYFCHSGQPASFYAAKVRKWETEFEAPMRAAFVPHDANAHDKGSGKTYVDHLKEAGLDKVVVVPRTPDEWQSINTLRALFPRIYIDSSRCTVPWTMGEMEMPSGVDCLDYYRKKEDASSGYVTDVPVHDQYSHGASALRTLAEAHKRGLIEGTSFTARESRHGPVKVLRGAGAGAYPQLRRSFNKPNVIR